MSGQQEVFTDLCAAGCGRRYEFYHKPCNLVFCAECIKPSGHVCRTEDDRTQFYPKPPGRKKKGANGAPEQK